MGSGCANSLGEVFAGDGAFADPIFMPRILILTASMGEGHNTAARNIQAALDRETSGAVEVRVVDPYSRTNPVVNRLMQRGYAMAINRYPRAWKVVFDFLGKPGVVEGMGPMLAELKAAIRAHVREFRPDLLVSTYPVFSFLVAKLRRRDSSFPPLYTVITDSTMINSAWYRCPCDGFLVADDATAAVLRKGKVPEPLIHTLGFPVGLAFEKIRPAAPPATGSWKAIFFPGGSARRAIETLQRLARIPGIEVTVVTGRRAAVHRVLTAARLPARGALLGWTDQMPALMEGHHFFIGKAGGATVQEAIAANLPFLVSHVVPGQEEGNIALIERSGIGALVVGNPGRVGDVIEGAIASGGALWKAWRSNLSRMARPSASTDIARFLLGVLKKL
jgi:processive 1,2-diacylglycerol beta-glucosyltransferase